MAHLTINPRISFNSLSAMLGDYYKQLDAASDPFAKMELIDFIHEIEHFCVFRGGMEYLGRIRESIGR